MKKLSFLTIASFLGVIVFALIWNLTSGALSVIGAALTLCAAAAFVVFVNRLSGINKQADSFRPDTDSAFHGNHAA